MLDEVVAAKLTEVGLSEFDGKRLSSGYSGGMKRKLSVACATIGSPQIGRFPCSVIRLFLFAMFLLIIPSTQSSLTSHQLAWIPLHAGIYGTSFQEWFKESEGFQRRIGHLSY